MPRKQWIGLGIALLLGGTAAAQAQGPAVRPERAPFAGVPVQALPPGSPGTFVQPGTAGRVVQGPAADRPVPYYAAPAGVYPYAQPAPTGGPGCCGDAAGHN